MYQKVSITVFYLLKIDKFTNVCTIEHEFDDFHTEYYFVFNSSVVQQQEYTNCITQLVD